MLNKTIFFFGGGGRRGASWNDFKVAEHSFAGSQR